MLHKVSFSLWLPIFCIWQPFYTFRSPTGCCEISWSLSIDTLFQYSSGSFSNNYSDGNIHGKKAIDLISKTTNQIEQDGIRKKKEQAAQNNSLFVWRFAAVAIVKIMLKLPITGTVLIPKIQLYHQLPSCTYSCTHRHDVYSVQLMMKWNQRY